MNLIAPLFLIIASVGIFYGYTNPNYRGENNNGSANVVKLMNERKQYAEALDSSKKFIDKLNKLSLVNNSLSISDLERLKKLVPDNIDNVKLIIDIDKIASRYGFHIRGIKIEDGAGNTGELGPDNSPLGSVVLSFNITASYDRFKMFIRDLEESLRVIDITNFTFNSTESGDYDYGIKIRTYWLK